MRIGWCARSAASSPFFVRGSYLMKMSARCARGSLSSGDPAMPNPCPAFFSGDITTLTVMSPTGAIVHIDQRRVRVSCTSRGCRLTCCSGRRASCSRRCRCTAAKAARRSRRVADAQAVAVHQLVAGHRGPGADHGPFAVFDRGVLGRHKVAEVRIDGGRHEPPPR